jgi:hypothetical protein
MFARTPGFLFFNPSSSNAVKPSQFEAASRTTRTRRMFFENSDRFNSAACIGIPPSRGIPVWVAPEGNSSIGRAQAFTAETRVRIPLPVPFHKALSKKCMALPGANYAERLCGMAKQR